VSTDGPLHHRRIVEGTWCMSVTGADTHKSSLAVPATLSGTMAVSASERHTVVAVAVGWSRGSAC
jgi:hypothetical protein